MKTLLMPVSVLLLASLMTACGGGGSGSSDDGDGTGTLSLGVTDAPVDDADKVVVRFNGVELKPAGGQAFEIMFDQPKDIDLLALQGGNVSPLITNATVPAGEYEWVRLMVTATIDNVLDSYIEIDGSQFELRVPSGAQTGLKLVSGFTVAEGGTANFTIDFDLRKSVVAPPGLDGNFMLKPALRLLDNLSVGTLSGTVDPSIIAAQCVGVETGSVYVYNGADVVPDDIDPEVEGEDEEEVESDDPVASAAVSLDDEGDYSYVLAFLAAGNYTASYTCDSDDDDPELDDDETEFVGTQNVTITANTTTTANFGP